MGGPPFSLLGITVVPPLVPGTGADRSVVERLHRARSAGVTTFDAAASPDRPRAERLLTEAFPEPDARLVIIVGRRQEDLVRPEGGPTSGFDTGPTFLDRWRRSIEMSQRRLTPNRVGVVEWLDAALPASLNGERETLTQLGAPGLCLCRRWIPDAAAPAPVPGEPPAPRLLSGGFSLLDPRAARSLGKESEVAELSFLARDPFAGGRLDGTRSSTMAVERGPGAGPIRLRDLEAEFGPVLRLGFLTEGRQRTMAQAAIRYASGWPWVGSVLVPLPTAERLEEILGTFAVPPISDQELGQLERLHAAPRALRTD
jgi:aryl-alcohol dehydrogenase-like predicted oxidoreductase